MKKVSTKIGNIVVWNDYIRSKKITQLNTVQYLQSNTKLDGYSQRYIGLYMDHNKNIYVAVALNSQEEDKGPWYKFILETRIKNNMSGNIQEKGITMVPYNYIDLLYKDPMAYNNLYGPIEPNMLDLAIAMAKNIQEQNINDYASKLASASRKA